MGKIRELHHDRARLIAIGLTYAQVARALNMTAAGIRHWAEVPANAELIAQLRADLQGTAANFVEYRTQLLHEIGLKALALINDQLAEAAEGRGEIPLPTLLRMADSANDRTGLAKSEVRVQLNMDIGSRLDAAREHIKKGVERRVEGNVVRLVRRT